jgi:hypothetical protein
MKIAARTHRSVHERISSHLHSSKVEAASIDGEDYLSVYCCCYEIETKHSDHLLVYRHLS